MSTSQVPMVVEDPVWGPRAFWTSAWSIDHSHELEGVVNRAIDDIFARKDGPVSQGLAPSSVNTASMGACKEGVCDEMRSEDSYVPMTGRVREHIVFSNSDSDSDSTMSETNGSCPNPESGSEEEWEPVWPAAAHRVRDELKDLAQAEGLPCVKCRAYDLHCKAAAETYTRTLDGYTRTVSELMCGFKLVLERYPELKEDSSDKRLFYMVQAALGRNNLVRTMVRLSTQGVRVRIPETDGLGSVSSVHAALNVCYTDRDALRLMLDKYADLYVQFVRVWRDMHTRVPRELTVMELMVWTETRPGVEYGGEPWCEAISYISRARELARGLVPGSLGVYCSGKLGELAKLLATVPRDPELCRLEGIVILDALRVRLDTEDQHPSWDAHMSNLSLDVRSDLTVLGTLIGVGVLSAKMLLHERHLLVGRIRRMHRDRETTGVCM